MASMLDLVTKAFYSWVQVRNYGALDKINQEKAENHDRIATMTKAFAAWRYAMQLVSKQLTIFTIRLPLIIKVETKPLETVNKLKSSTTVQPTTQLKSLSRSTKSHSALVSDNIDYHL